MKIILVRHGETDYNKQNRLQGHSNILLNDSGRRQSKNLRMELNDIDIDICFSSPLVRSFESAMILVGDRVEIRKDPRLIERNFGLYEGKDRKDYPSKKYWNYNLNLGDNDVEKVQDLFKRVEDFINYLDKNFENKTILVVSHASVIRVIHSLLKKENYKSSVPMFNIKNCYLEVIEK